MIPPKANAAFVAAMEDVLEVYHRPYDPTRPVVCPDEGGKQLIGDVRPPLPVRPKHPAKEDHEYKRNGTANVFMLFEPLRGWRHAEVCHVAARFQQTGEHRMPEHRAAGPPIAAESHLTPLQIRSQRRRKRRCRLGGQSLPDNAPNSGDADD